MGASYVLDALQSYVMWSSWYPKWKVFIICYRDEETKTHRDEINCLQSCGE